VKKVIFVVIFSMLIGMLPGPNSFAIKNFSTPSAPVSLPEILANVAIETPITSISSNSELKAPLLEFEISATPVLATANASETPTSAGVSTSVQAAEAPAAPQPVQAQSAPVQTVSSPKPVASAPKNSISVAGRTLNIVNVNSTSVDSGNHVNRIGKLLYGHNSATVFKNLSSLKIGSTFSVTIDGSTKTYRVAKITTYEKNKDGRLQLNGSGNYMKAIRDKALGHDLAVMTCAGTSYGNGDASHRLVIFANAI